MDYPSEEIICLVKSLYSSRERYSLELQLGIEAERQYTLQEIADRLNVTRERVRQIQNRV
jgi:DNA-directed RNA polymerase sigma subunit (sigma70/sigma32)